jgi:hypothetical protein
MPERTRMITCKGTKPGTTDKCGVALCETDGQRFLIRGLVLELDPPRVRCSECGYVTRLTYEVKNCETGRT